MERDKREQVIKALEKAVEVFDGRIFGPMYDMWMDATKDAIALLKAQEPVEAIIETTYGTAECDDPWGRLIFCGACGKRINEKYNPDEDDKYCKHCGKPVKYDG